MKGGFRGKRGGSFLEGHGPSDEISRIERVTLEEIKQLPVAVCLHAVRAEEFQFAGDDPARAWVAPEIRAALDEVGPTSEHFELALGHELERLLGVSGTWERADASDGGA